MIHTCPTDIRIPLIVSISESGPAQLPTFLKKNYTRAFRGYPCRKDPQLCDQLGDSTIFHHLPPLLLPTAMTYAQIEQRCINLTAGLEKKIVV